MYGACSRKSVPCAHSQPRSCSLHQLRLRVRGSKNGKSFLRGPSDRAPRYLGSGCSAQQSADADILVDVGPVDTSTIADETPVAALICLGVEQAREPRQGRAHSPAIGQVDNQVVFIGPDVDRPGIRLRAGSSHAMPPGTPLDVRPRAVPVDEARVPGTDSTTPKIPAPARTWQRRRPAPRGREAAPALGRSVRFPAEPGRPRPAGEMPEREPEEGPPARVPGSPSAKAIRRAPEARGISVPAPGVDHRRADVLAGARTRVDARSVVAEAGSVPHTSTPVAYARVNSSCVCAAPPVVSRGARVWDFRLPDFRVECRERATTHAKPSSTVRLRDGRPPAVAQPEDRLLGGESQAGPTRTG